MNAGGVDKACKSNGRITWDVMLSQKSIKSKVHKVNHMTLQTLRLSTLRLEHRVSRDASVADEVVIIKYVP